MQPVTPSRAAMSAYGPNTRQAADWTALEAALLAGAREEEAEGRADPAPSRWAYRIQRWWLTPLVRLAVRAGVPLVAAFALSAWFLSDQDRIDDINLRIAEAKAWVQERPEFMLHLMAIDGASEEVAEDLREILPMDFPVSSWDLDLEHMRRAALELDAVAAAAIRIRPGGVLQLDITERKPALVWRSRDGLELLDGDGNRVAALTRRGERADLPLIAGDGADDHAAEALSLLRAAAPLNGEVIGLMRMGERRWDVMLTEDRRIMLPENAPVRALERVIALHQARDMLARDIDAVDLRNPARPTLRIRSRAVEAYQDLRRMSAEGQASQ